MFYHLSTNDNLKVLTPRVPETALAIYEDVKTKRVCFAKTISGCLSALQSIPEDYYVYVPSNSVQHIVPNSKQVRDAGLTGEVWVLDETPVKCIGRIRSYDWSKSKRYDVDGQKVTRFFYRWKWIERYT